MEEAGMRDPSDKIVTSINNPVGTTGNSSANNITEYNPNFPNYGIFNDSQKQSQESNKDTKLVAKEVVATAFVSFKNNKDLENSNKSNKQAIQKDQGNSSPLQKRTLSFSEDTKILIGKKEEKAKIDNSGVPQRMDSKVFEFNSSYYELKLAKRDIPDTPSQQAGFNPIKMDFEMVVYGDPHSEQKLKFLERINATNKAGSLFPAFDSLAAPPPQDIEIIPRFEIRDIIQDSDEGG